MTPMVVLLWSGGGSTVIALGPMIVVVAFQVASSLTWLSLSGEDAPELLATAPVSAATLRRGKLEAVGALTLAVVALPLVWLAAVSLAGAAITLALIGFAVGSAVLLQSWHGKPAKRSAFAARHRESKLLALDRDGPVDALGHLDRAGDAGQPLGLGASRGLVRDSAVQPSATAPSGCLSSTSGPAGPRLGPRDYARQPSANQLFNHHRRRLRASASLRTLLSRQSGQAHRSLASSMRLLPERRVDDSRPQDPDRR